MDGCTDGPDEQCPLFPDSECTAPEQFILDNESIVCDSSLAGSCESPPAEGGLTDYQYWQLYGLLKGRGLNKFWGAFTLESKPGSVQEATGGTTWWEPDTWNSEPLPPFDSYTVDFVTASARAGRVGCR